MQSTSSIQEPWNISPHSARWKIHGNGWREGGINTHHSLATRTDFWKIGRNAKNENYDQTKHKTGLPNSVTISGNMPGEEAGSGWWIMSLYTWDLLL